ncbi:unnamed protein product, partial [Ixodes pacificus]
RHLGSSRWSLRRLLPPLPRRGSSNNATSRQRVRKLPIARILPLVGRSERLFPGLGAVRRHDAAAKVDLRLWSSSPIAAAVGSESFDLDIVSGKDGFRGETATTPLINSSSIFNFFNCGVFFRVPVI